jgi:hypothetical protein
MWALIVSLSCSYFWRGRKNTIQKHKREPSYRKLEDGVAPHLSLSLSLKGAKWRRE